MKTKFLFIVTLFITCMATSFTTKADSQEFICLAVMCVYAEKYGGGGDEGCIKPLDKVTSIVKKVGGLIKKVSCPLTIAQRIAWLSQCKSNIHNLEDIVTCKL